MFLVLPALYADAGSPYCFYRRYGNDSGGGSVNLTSSGPQCTSKQALIGGIGVVVAIGMFGTNLIPVKKIDTGDGMFFQWMMCIGIWLVGLVINFIQQQPPFFYASVLGGFLWTTGNVLCVPVIKTIGLTVGITVWGLSNMFGGWLVGRFLLNQDPKCQPLNYVGIFLICSSFFALAAVRSDTKAGKKKLHGGAGGEASETSKLLQADGSQLSVNSSSNVYPENTQADSDYSWVERLGKWPRIVIGLAMALTAGVFFGQMFLPIIFLQHCQDGHHSTEGWDYLFGHYTGILATSTLYIGIYSIAKCNKPAVYPKAILPGLISGIMWGIATAAWFKANDNLTLSISFPLIASGPGIVTFAFGLFLYREFKGWKNYLFYSIALAIQLPGMVMVGLSQCTSCGV